MKYENLKLLIYDLYKISVRKNINLLENSFILLVNTDVLKDKITIKVDSLYLRVVNKKTNYVNESMYLIPNEVPNLNSLVPFINETHNLLFDFGFCKVSYVDLVDDPKDSEQIFRYRALSVHNTLSSIDLINKLEEILNS